MLLLQVTAVVCLVQNKNIASKAFSNLNVTLLLLLLLLLLLQLLHITMTASHHSVFYRPDALPAAQPTASKH